jgi:predicted nucleotidyltransferase
MMKKKQQILKCLADHAPEIRKRFAVKNLAVFGSVIRDDAANARDVDILVVFEGKANFDRFMDLKLYLEDLISMKVDLVTQDALRPQLRSGIEQEAIHVA